MFDPPPGRRQPPAFTAPGPVVWLAGLLVALHGLRAVLLPALGGGRMFEQVLFYELALIPERLSLFLSGTGNPAAYSPGSLLLAGVGHAFLHLDWMHVLVNAIMLLATGAPVARRLGIPGFLAIFFGAVLGGALVFFLVRLPDGAPAVGASGGVSGLIAAVLLVMQAPRGGWGALTRGHFLRASGAFMVLNLLLAFIGPALFGAGIAWDAHVGGYLTGAVLMAWATERQRRQTR